MGATYVAQGPNGTREIAAGDFFEGFLTTALAPDEMLTEIRVPKMNGAGWSFQKFNRRAQDWAIVGVAAWRNGTESGVGLVNMGSVPILATSVVPPSQAARPSKTLPPRLPHRPTPRETSMPASSTASTSHASSTKRALDHRLRLRLAGYANRVNFPALAADG